MKRVDLPVMILAGGLGTRLREETEFRPKPMVPIGGKPILWHIMKMYSYYGFHRFIICLGYKGEMIKNYFLNYRLDDIDITVNKKTGAIVEHQVNQEDWEVTLVETGYDCLTGGRIARAAKYVDADRFLLTYGDGVADINIDALLAFHEQHGRLATLTGVNLPSRFGNLEINNDQVVSFKEKQQISDEWISSGFFVLEKKALNYVSTDGRCIWEQDGLPALAADSQLMVYKHRGFWQCMDTQREHQMLEELWKKDAPWKVWKDGDKFEPALKSTLEIDGAAQKQSNV